MQDCNNVKMNCDFFFNIFYSFDVVHLDFILVDCFFFIKDSNFSMNNSQ